MGKRRRRRRRRKRRKRGPFHDDQAPEFYDGLQLNAIK